MALEIIEQPEGEKIVKKDGTTTSGYGSETSGEIDQLLKQQKEKAEREQSTTGEDHCVRCHKDCVLELFSNIDRLSLSLN